MKEITSLLTANQTQKLNAMRKEEYERLRKRREQAKGDNSADMPQSTLPGMVRSFSFMSSGTENESSWFSVDEVFRYPERELWLGENMFGSNIEMFNFNGDGMSGDMPSMQGLERFLEGFGFDDSQSGSHHRQFHFRNPQQGEEEEWDINRDSPSKEDADEDLMDATPYTLPKTQPGFGGRKPDGEKESGDKSAANKERMQNKCRNYASH